MARRRCGFQRNSEDLHFCSCAQGAVWVMIGRLLRRADREAEGARLLSEYSPKGNLGFESPALRQLTRHAARALLGRRFFVRINAGARCPVRHDTRAPPRLGSRRGATEKIAENRSSARAVAGLRGSNGVPKGPLARSRTPCEPFIFKTSRFGNAKSGSGK